MRRRKRISPQRSQSSQAETDSPNTKRRFAFAGRFFVHKKVNNYNKNIHFLLTFLSFGSIILVWLFLPTCTFALKKGKPFSMSTLKRREARELVIALLFETEFKDGESTSEIYELSADNREIPDDEYIKRAYFGVCENRERIDELIGKNARGWKTNRLTRLSRSVMRLAVYEMLFEDKIPNSVSINEAVELTKKFDDPKAKAFVNGVLNSVKNEIEADENKDE